MNTILWYQGSFESQKGMMIVDGEQKTYGDSPLHNDALDKLFSAHKWPERYGTDSSLLICFNPSTKEVFVQSHFEDRDEQGRKLAFMFYLNEFHSADDVCEELKKNASIAEKTVSESDMQTIREKVSLRLRKKNTSYCLIAAGVISLTLILALVCRNCQGK